MNLSFLKESGKIWTFPIVDRISAVFFTVNSLVSNKRYLDFKRWEYLDIFLKKLW